jgi:hypothetical protein
MPEDFLKIDYLRIQKAAISEIEYIRDLGATSDLAFATANLSGYEALLLLLSGDNSGTPVYQVVSSIKSQYSTQSGVIGRIRAMRRMGLIEARPGTKKSQVCLVPSEKLLRELAPILLRRYGEER